MGLFRHGRGSLVIHEHPKDAAGMEFVVLRDDDEQLHLSKDTYDHGDFPFRYMIKAFDLAEYVGEEEVGIEAPLYIELAVVSPKAAGKDNIIQALSSCGMDMPEVPQTKEEWAVVREEANTRYGRKNRTRKELGYLKREERERLLCEVLHSYGTSAGIYSLIGGHARVFNDGWWEEPEGVDLAEELNEGVRLMKQHALFVDSMFGFYMDAPLNAIMNTGWDFVAGKVGFK